MSAATGSAGAWRRAALPAMVLAAALAASAFPSRFALERESVGRGELWRLWTGHLVHVTPAHFVLDVGAGLLLFVLLPLGSAPRTLLLLPPLVGLGVLVAAPEIDAYCGASGVLHGLAVLTAARIARGSSGAQRCIALAALAAIVAKAVLETALGAPVLTGGLDLGGAPVHVAHLLGVACGFLLLGGRRAVHRGAGKPVPAGGGLSGRRSSSIQFGPNSGWRPSPRRPSALTFQSPAPSGPRKGSPPCPSSLASPPPSSRRRQ